jgi:hypothetical protein
LPDENKPEAVPAITVDDIDRAPENALVTGGDTIVSTEALRDAFVRTSEENAALKEELDRTKKRVRTIEILDELIEPMAKAAFIFMCVYCGVVGALVTFHGFKLEGFALPESVLKFLVGSTATTVIGLVGMVLTGIFVGARNSGKD